MAVRRGRLRASTPTTVKQAGAALVAGMCSGAILDRSGKPYKPKTVRTYEHALETYIFPFLGNRKVSTLRRADVQGFVEERCALGAAPSTVHNRLDPLRVIVRRAIHNDELLVDPCARLKVPVVRNNRTRREASTTAEALIAALPESEQAFWRSRCSPASDGASSARSRSTTSTSRPGLCGSGVDGTTSRGRSTPRRSRARNIPMVKVAGFRGPRLRRG